MKMLNIAVITPIGSSDMLSDTVLDGLLSLKREGVVDFRLLDAQYLSAIETGSERLPVDEFYKYANQADLVFLLYGKRKTQFEVAEKINRWNVTIFIDGSEVGGNKRYDPKIQFEILHRTYSGEGKVNTDMLSRSCLYFKREKPYINGILPLPFGIESRYFKNYNPESTKDIDFCCIFGQDEYPPLRYYAREYLKEFCAREGFRCVTEQTTGFNFDGARQAGRDQFYSLLARSKVGVSIGGGGFDTARFWEILGNNCLLMTESIAITLPNETVLDDSRTWQFKNLFDFKESLDAIAIVLRESYNQLDFTSSYENILAHHSTSARVGYIIAQARKKGIIAE